MDDHHAWGDWLEIGELHNDNTVWKRTCERCKASQTRVSKLYPNTNKTMLRSTEITEATHVELVDYLAKNDCSDEAKAAVSNLTQRQALGILNYINNLPKEPALVALKWVLHDLKGITSGDEMFKPITARYQPED